MIGVVLTYLVLYCVETPEIIFGLARIEMFLISMSITGRAWYL